MAKWPWRYKSWQKVIMRDTPSHLVIIFAKGGIHTHPQPPLTKTIFIFVTNCPCKHSKRLEQNFISYGVDRPLSLLQVCISYKLKCEHSSKIQISKFCKTRQLDSTTQQKVQLWQIAMTPAMQKTSKSLLGPLCVYLWYLLRLTIYNLLYVSSIGQILNRRQIRSTDTNLACFMQSFFRLYYHIHIIAVCYLSVVIRTAYGLCRHVLRTSQITLYVQWYLELHTRSSLPRIANNATKCTAKQITH